MLKNITKIFVAGAVLLALQPVYSMEIYTVKPGDYLFKIAKSNTVSGVSVGELTDAIKGINKSEVPGIVDNRIQVGNKLAIPTTKDEVEDGLTLSRNSMMQGSYDQQADTPKESTSSKFTTVKNTQLGDQAMISSNSVDETSKKAQPSSISETIPSMIPDEDNTNANVITYENDLDSQIDESNVQENESYDSASSESSSMGSIFGKLIKFIFSLIILVGLFIAAKKVWDNRNSKKAQEQEIIAKKKRDHLMSRISPVVSDTGFYKSANEGPQEAFDFFATRNNMAQPNSRNSIDESHSVNEDTDGEEAAKEQNDLADLYHNKGLGNHSEKNVAIKTEKGMVFETASSDKFTSVDNTVEEIDTDVYEENEMEYIEELIEQYLESEKYIEASITIQDSLEKDQNNVNLRYMLLEVYARAGDEIAFEGEVHFIKSKNIVSMFDPLHQKIAKLRDKYFEYS